MTMQCSVIITALLPGVFSPIWGLSVLEVVAFGRFPIRTVGLLHRLLGMGQRKFRPPIVA